MKFFTDKIVTKPISLEEAAKKAASSAPVRSLDEMLADLKQVKTAASNAQTKTAVDKVEKTEAPVNQVESKTKVESKVKLHVEASLAEEKVEKKAASSDDVEVVEIVEKETKKEVAKAQAKPSKMTLKVAKKLDFRNWEAEDVVKAWAQHGSVNACIENVAGGVSDPKTYCGLLQIAGGEAKKVIAARSKPADKQGKKQSKAAAASPFVKISKLTDKDRDLLAKYYTRIYGKDYVDALLEDY